MSVLGDPFMSCGRLFESKGVEYLNEQAVKVSCLTLGIARVVPLLFDLMLLKCWKHYSSKVSIMNRSIPH